MCGCCSRWFPEKMTFELRSEGLARWRGRGGVGREQVQELSEFQGRKGQCGRTGSDGRDFGTSCRGCQGRRRRALSASESFLSLRTGNYGRIFIQCECDQLWGLGGSFWPLCGKWMKGDGAGRPVKRRESGLEGTWRGQIEATWESGWDSVVERIPGSAGSLPVPMPGK